MQQRSLADAFPFLKAPECQVISALLAYQRATRDQLEKLLGITSARMGKALDALVTRKVIVKARDESFSLSESTLAGARSHRPKSLPEGVLMDEQPKAVRTNTHVIVGTRLRVDPVFEISVTRAQESVSRAFESYAEAEALEPAEWSRSALLGMFFAKLAEDEEWDEAEAMHRLAPVYAQCQSVAGALITKWGCARFHAVVKECFGGQLDWITKGSDMLGRISRSDVLMRRCSYLKIPRGQEQSHWENTADGTSPGVVRRC